MNILIIEEDNILRVFRERNRANWADEEKQRQLLLEELQRISKIKTITIRLYEN